MHERSTWPTLQLTTAALTAALAEHFGHAEFRPGQLEAVRATLSGRDLLLTQPTGAGKSLVYQLPALLLDGLTLVISPLIALAEDQVTALRARGLPASFVNSSLDGPTRERRLEAACRGEVKLLYVTPERFRSPRFLERLDSLNVVRLAVDEAHCISEWGHDFRPDYWRLGEYRRQLGSPPTAALTATATERVAADITSQLDLRDPWVARDGIERPNLFLAASRYDHEEQRSAAIAERIAQIGGPGIVYATLIRDLEYLHGELRRRGIPALVYHGKLSAEERRRMQRRFMDADDEVVLATNAFGMGVDKPDIRFVLHAQLPRTVEALTQELGRAGRDGNPAWCEVFAHEPDLALNQNFIQWANPDAAYFEGLLDVLAGWGERTAARDLDDLRAELLVKNRSDNRVSICLAWAATLGLIEGSFERHDLRLVRRPRPSELPESFGGPQKLRRDLESLLDVWTYAVDPGGCRRRVLERHFGLEREGSGDCGACDVCCPADGWRTRRLAPRTVRESGALDDGAAALAGAVPQQRSNHGATSDSCADSADAPYRRGDWVRVDGRHLGQILRVEGRCNRVRLLVESTSDLRQRRVDPRRSTVERLEGASED